MHPALIYDCTPHFVHFAYKFTGKERDAESGLDNFGARYYASNMGRFMSPDWSEAPDPIPYANIANPQSLNLYSYGANNPLSNIDDDGHCYGEVKYSVFTCIADFFKNLLGGSGNGGNGGNHGDVPDYWPNENGRQLTAELGRRAPAATKMIEAQGVIAVASVAAPVAIVGASGAGVSSLGLESMSSGALNDAIGPTQRILLREFLGDSMKGAQSALQNPEAPEGLTPRSLEIYKEIARRVIARGPGAPGYAVQAARLAAIEKVLEKMVKK
jgi:RHS repeat-associated protein